MEKVKTKFMCVYASESISFTKGKIYEGYAEELGGSCITDNRGFVYDCLEYTKFFGVKFVPLNELTKKVKYISSEDKSEWFINGGYYFVNKDGSIYDEYGYLRSSSLFCENEFEIIEDYT